MKKIERKGAFAMAFVCPACQREFEMETEFCPACGAPMNEDAFRIHKKHEKANAVLQPMKWYKFLIYFSIPLSLVLLVINLSGTVNMLKNFDPALYKPEMLSLVQMTLYIDLGCQSLLLPAMLLTEIWLAKKQWKGVQGLWFIYGLQILYAIAGTAVLAQMDLDVMTVVSTLLPGVGMAVRMALEMKYFGKRRDIFSPVKE